MNNDIERLKQIAELMLEVIHRTKLVDMGLFKGNAGICFALSLLNKCLNDTRLENEADKIMEMMPKRLSLETSVSFDIGLAGIGWTLNELLMRGLYTGDADDVLSDVDAMVFRDLNTRSKVQARITDGLVGYLFYIVDRLRNPGHSKDTTLHEIDKSMLRMIIDRLESAVPSIFSSISKDTFFSILWGVPLMIVYFRKALDLNVYNEKIKNTVKEWLFYLSCEMPAYNINRLYLAVSLAYLNEALKWNEISRIIDVLMYSVDFEELKSEIDSRIMNINEGWPVAIVILKKAEELLESSVPNFMRIRDVRLEILKKINKSWNTLLLSKIGDEMLDICFIQGLSGLAVLWCLFPDAYRVDNI